MPLDTARHRETPEGVTLTLRPAGAPARAVAWLLDLLILGAAATGFAILTSLLGVVGVGLHLLFFFALNWGYGVAFEMLRNGATPGKSVLGLRVTHDDGTPVTLRASVLRNLLRFADFLPMAYGAGIVTMLLDPDSRRLGDLVAGTVVVYDPTDRWSDLPAADAIAPSVALSAEERAALVSFAVRVPSWSTARRAELADILHPLTRLRGPEGVDRLVSIAHHLLGGEENPG